jgi:HEAT repeat protein
MQAILNRRGQLRRRVERLLGTPEPPVRLRHGTLFMMLVLLTCGFALYAQVAPPQMPAPAQQEEWAPVSPSERSQARPTVVIADSSDATQPLAQPAAPLPPAVAAPPAVPSQPREPIAPPPAGPADQVQPVLPPSAFPTAAPLAEPRAPIPPAAYTVDLEKVPPQWRELVEQTRDQDWWLRKVAIVELAERAKEPAARAAMGFDVVRILIGGLKDENPNVQAAAAEGLGKLRDPSAIKHLVAALKEKSPVPEAASEALLQFPPQEVLPLLRMALEEPALYWGAVRALSEMGSPEAAQIIFLTPPKPDSMRKSLFMELVLKINPEFVAEPLNQALRTFDAESQTILLTMLAPSVDNADKSVIEKTAKFVAYPPLSSAIESALLSPSFEVRTQALNALRTWAWLIDTAQMPIPEEMTRAIAIALRDENSLIEINAYSTLEQLHWTPNDKEQKLWFDMLGALAGRHDEALIAMGPAVVEPLIHVLQSDKRLPRPAGRRTAGQTDLREPMQHVIRVLGELRDRRAIPPLLEVMKTDDVNCGLAAEALGKIGDPAVVPALLEELKRERCQDDVIKAITSIKDPGSVELLIQMLNDPQARLVAVWALGEMRDPRAVPPLLDLLQKIQTDPALAGNLIVYNERLLYALGKIGGKEAVGPIAAFAKTQNVQTKGNAIDALGEIGGDEAVAALLEMLQTEDDTIFKKVVDNLAKTKSPAAAEALGKLLSSDNKARQAAAVSALLLMDTPEARRVRSSIQQPSVSQK